MCAGSYIIANLERPSRIMISFHGIALDNPIVPFLSWQAVTPDMLGKLLSMHGCGSSSGWMPICLQR